jgi:hypothetical protein
MAVTTPLRVEGTRAYAQGEIFLLTEAGDHMDALVYNTTGFGPCPKDGFEAIDVERLAQETGSDRAWKNPRRFWMMDALTVDIVGEPAEFHGVKFNLLAKMSMPAAFDFDQDQSAMAYHPMQIRRVSTYEFQSGRSVYLLRSPDEVTWVMQTFTDHVDPTLTEADLLNLGERLTLPEGWAFKPVTLAQDFSITTGGVANIVPDNLSNMYQGCVGGVNNFDPWDSAS